MNLDLPPDLAAFVENQVSCGAFSTPQGVVIAALESLRADCQFGDFAPGELNRFLEEGEHGGDERGWFTEDDARRELAVRRDRIQNRESL